MRIYFLLSNTKMFIILIAFGFLLDTTSAGVAVTPVHEERDPYDTYLDSFPIVAGIYKVFHILPGTYWCGTGNISNNNEDLGHIAKTDNCCRSHDKCPDSIPGGKFKHGLHNNGWYTRSHCNCDLAFYKCLKDAGNPLSIITGTTYFTVLGPQCFDKVYPISDCEKEELGRCVKYAFNKSAKPMWQWMDNPIF